jgi:hypothetical protein
VIMGREVIMVAPGWECPDDFIGCGDYERELKWWRLCRDQWEVGLCFDGQNSDQDDPIWIPLEPDSGPYLFQPPNREQYFPDWKPEEATHYMMFQNVCDLSPISPAFPTKEELAGWLADTGASACAGRTATYDQWLAMINQGYAASCCLTPNEIISGVEGV